MGKKQNYQTHVMAQGCCGDGDEDLPKIRNRALDVVKFDHFLLFFLQQKPNRKSAAKVRNYHRQVQGYLHMKETAANIRMYTFVVLLVVLMYVCICGGAIIYYI